MLTWLASALTGGALKTALNGISDWHERKLNAQNNSERIEADRMIGELEARASVLRAEAGHRINLWFRGFIALGPALYLAKIFIVDKVACPVFGLPDSYCRTDALSTELWAVVTIVLGFYFVSSAFGRRP